MQTGDAFNQAVQLTLIELVADYGAKVQSPLLAYGGYNLLAWKLSSALERNSLILTNSYWDGLSNLMTTILGWSMGERPSAHQWLGILLIASGIFLLQLDGAGTPSK